MLGTISEMLRSGVEERLAKEDLVQLLEGSLFWKVRSNNWYPRRFWLDLNNLCIRYEPSKKPFWTTPITHVDLVEIDQVRPWKSSLFRDVSSSPGCQSLVHGCCFSIVYGTREINLVAANEQTAQTWQEGLKSLLAITRSIHHENKHQIWLMNQFIKADKDKSGELDFNEVLHVLDLMNIKLTRCYAYEIFMSANVDKKMGRNGVQVLDCKEFVRFVSLLTKRPDLEKLFANYAKTNCSALTASELVLLLEREQHMKVDAEKAQQLIDEYDSAESAKEPRLSFPGFINMMTCRHLFNIRLEEHFRVNQDMTKPLNQYYIASSHNTYLTGHQLTGKSRVGAYIDVLETGCRCVELDLWDGPNGEPVIYHGYTMTNDISVRDVLTEAILPYAFKSSAYPLILSFENHLSPRQQGVMAVLLKDILGDALYDEPVSEDMAGLPSPHQLRYKIIIKSKKSSVSESRSSIEGPPSEVENLTELTQLHATVSLQESYGSLSSWHKELDNESVKKSQESRESNESKEPKVETVAVGEDSSKPEIGPRTSFEPTDGEGAEESAAPMLENSGDSSETNSYSAPDGNIIKPCFVSSNDDAGDVKLSNLVNLCQAVSFRGFQHSAENGRCFHTSSLSEAKAGKLIADPWDMIQLTNRQMIRIYPKGSRTDSSNYNPIPFWNVGCQMVALNYQTEGIFKSINAAKFAANGNCGYILKPEVLRTATCNFLQRTGKIQKIITIRVISAQNLPKVEGDEKDVIDPYVSVKVHGHPADEQRFKTKVISNNGFNPVWNEEMEFMLEMPEFDVIEMSVNDKDTISHDFVAASVIPVNSLRPGYSHVELFSAQGILLPLATLFLHVAVRSVTQDANGCLSLTSNETER